MIKRAGMSAALLFGAVSGAGAQGPWVTGYYPAWRQSRLPPAQVDFSALTTLVHFSVVPRSDGSLDAAVNLMNPANVEAAVAAAHAAGTKILFTVGGQGSRLGFKGAMSRQNRKKFIAALSAFMRENGYDGIDVDMEELLGEDAQDYARFIRELRTELDGIVPRPLLTAAALWEPALFARLAGQFDQINLMTYNLAGPYPGWVVWHSGALYDGGQRFPDGKTPLPSVDGLVEKFLAAGVPRSKLGVGLSFHGYVWSGSDVGGPGRGWGTPPEMRAFPYHQLADVYRIGSPGADGPGYHWDARAEAPYMSIAGSGGADSHFVSFENEVSAGRRFLYLRRKGLGGLIIWDLSAGYLAEAPVGSRDALLQAVKRGRLGSSEAVP